MARERNDAKISEDLMRVARTKLRARQGPLLKKAVLDPSSIAILSARIFLDMSSSSSLARQYEQEQVSCNLRLLYSVHRNHETIASGSPPEPLIAEASAQLMYETLETKNEPYMDIWELVLEFVDEGFLPQGSVGELLGRVLSILAMDRAIQGMSTPCQLKYQTPVKVVDYYKALLTDEAWDTLRKSTPANYFDLGEKSGKIHFEDAFASAYFHFSHYARAGDATPMQDRYAWAYWIRGTAILCQLNQKLTDRAHPIFFFEPDRVVSERWMSMALEQDKTSQTEDPTCTGIQSAEVLGLFTQGQKLPYIAAVHCYALTRDQKISVPTTAQDTHRWKSADEVAPRYQIDLSGLSPYRSLSDAKMDTIRTMINNTKNAVFKNHSRIETIDGVRMMLPLLNDHPYATAWIYGLPGQGRLSEDSVNRDLSIKDIGSGSSSSTSSLSYSSLPYPPGPPSPSSRVANQDAASAHGVGRHTGQRHSKRRKRT